MVRGHLLLKMSGLACCGLGGLGGRGSSTSSTLQQQALWTSDVHNVSLYRGPALAVARDGSV
jgi:hypothetical protein